MNAEAKPVLKKYRKNCIRVIHAVADKGMDYPLKIEVLMGLEYTQLMGSFQIKYRDRQMQDGGVDEKQEEEEDFFAEVSESVMRIGLWSLELFQNHDKMLTNPAQHAQYETIFTQLVQIAINLMNTDKPKIGRHIIEFVSHWLLLLKKVDKPENFAQFYQLALVELFNVSTSRICYPNWFKFRNN